MSMFFSRLQGPSRQGQQHISLSRSTSRMRAAHALTAPPRTVKDFMIESWVSEKLSESWFLKFFGVKIMNGDSLSLSWSGSSWRSRRYLSSSTGGGPISIDSGNYSSDGPKMSSAISSLGTGWKLMISFDDCCVIITFSGTLTAISDKAFIS